jgi:hypothetical protein
MRLPQHTLDWTSIASASHSCPAATMQCNADKVERWDGLGTPQLHACHSFSGTIVQLHTAHRQCNRQPGLRYLFARHHLLCPSNLKWTGIGTSGFLRSTK